MGLTNIKSVLKKKNNNEIYYNNSHFVGSTFLILVLGITTSRYTNFNNKCTLKGVVKCLVFYFFKKRIHSVTRL